MFDFAGDVSMTVAFFLWWINKHTNTQPDQQIYHGKRVQAFCRSFSCVLSKRLPIIMIPFTMHLDDWQELWDLLSCPQWSRMKTAPARAEYAINGSGLSCYQDCVVHSGWWTISVVLAIRWNRQWNDRNSRRAPVGCMEHVHNSSGWLSVECILYLSSFYRRPSHVSHRSPNYWLIYNIIYAL